MSIISFSRLTRRASLHPEGQIQIDDVGQDRAVTFGWVLARAKKCHALKSVIKAANQSDQKVTNGPEPLILLLRKFLLLAKSGHYQLDRLG